MRACLVSGVMLIACAASWAQAEEPLVRVRFAQFNIFELGRDKLGAVDAEGRGTHAQLKKAAEILQRVRPDVLLVNEIDYDYDGGDAARRFLDRYLAVPHNGQAPLDYAHVFQAPVNTGVASGFDLDKDGKTDGPADAWGFGRYPGQYGMALYSRYPLAQDAVRTFQKLAWKDMPGHLMPDGGGGRPAWYTADEAALLRLSSKSHWDVPLRIGEALVHVIAAHPTPGVFDGPEDWNGRRNFDEIRLIADYLGGGERGRYLVDDAGRSGGLADGALCVVMGDMNADPDAEAPYGQPAIRQLLAHPRLRDPAPKSAGAAAANPQSSRPDETTTDGFGRADYVLPCVGLEVVASGVFWPAAGDPLAWLVSEPDPASDHRLVWVDVLVGSRDVSTRAESRP
jgi:hypothetical protein